MRPVASMTGYASVDGETSLGSVAVECRSVNSRFLDLTLRIDDSLRFAEPVLREAVQKRLSRGKVELRISLCPNDSAMPAVSDAALKRVLNLQSVVLAASPEARPLSVAEILAIPGVAQASAANRDVVAAELLKIVGEALDALVAARVREGAALAKVILGYCGTMSVAVSEVRAAIPQILEQLQTKLAERLEKALAEKSVLTADEMADRIRQEVTLYAVKLDVDEEMNRLETHLKEVRRLLEAGGNVGRKLDFMAQEMNREANTLGSKAAAIEMTNASLALKITIDQMREQIQNLE